MSQIASDVVLYFYRAKLNLALKSIVEEYKTGKVSLLCMFEDFGNEVVRSIQPSLRTCRKLRIQEVMNVVEMSLELRENIWTYSVKKRSLSRT